MAAGEQSPRDRDVHDAPPEPADPAHAPGHRHLGPPPEEPVPPDETLEPAHDQPWVPTSGLTDRKRRSPRQ
jgi:hypothetical protein